VVGSLTCHQPGGFLNPLDLIGRDIDQRDMVLGRKQGLCAQRPKKVHFGGSTGLPSGSSIPYLPDILGVMG
jgi:hypothetical protein